MKAELDEKCLKMRGKKSAEKKKLEGLIHEAKELEEVKIFLDAKLIKTYENDFKEYVQSYVRKEAWGILNPQKSWTGWILNGPVMTNVVRHFKGVDLDTARKLLGRVFREDTEEFPRILQVGLDKLKELPAESELFQYANNAFTILTPSELKAKRDKDLSCALHKAKMEFPDLPNSDNMDSVKIVPDPIFGPFATLNLLISYLYKKGKFSTDRPPMHPHSRTKKRQTDKALQS